MATYQTRQRDPLLDQGTQAMLERRSRELLGLALCAIGLAFAALLFTYSPDDPGWMVATEEPAHNLLGRFGASVSSTLIILIGKGAWFMPLVVIAWGIRFVLHRGGERALARIVFAVIGVAIASVYAAALVPGTAWPHSFGLGGLFGDTILGALIGLAPGDTGLGLKLISVLAFLALVAMGLYVTGFDRDELRALVRFLLASSVQAYSAGYGLVGRGAVSTLRASHTLQERLRDRAGGDPVRTADWQPPVTGKAVAPANIVPYKGNPRRATTVNMAPEPLQASAAWNAPATLRADHRPSLVPDAPKMGFLARLRRSMDIAPPSELVDYPARDVDLSHLPSDERIKARIGDAVRAKMRAEPSVVGASSSLRREPPVIRSAAPAWDDTTTPAHGSVENALDDDDFDPVDARDADEALMFRSVQGPAGARAVVQSAPRKGASPSRQAMAEAQPRLRFDDPAPAFELPPLSLLSMPEPANHQQLSSASLQENARMLESVLDDYGVKGEIVSVRPGPVVTMYELEPAPGLKASRVIGLADDIARSMSALSARVSTVPGRTVIGIELPNVWREKVVLREILSSRDFGDSQMRLPLALGKDIAGDPIVANLAKMPHLLIAGTTGSGKSVAINTMILSLLYKLSPEECRMIMIDPKMLELSVYDGIPHLLSPVVTDPKKAVVALKWVVGEMEERYRKMSKMGVRNIEGYNGRVREALAKNEMFVRTFQTGFDEDTGDPVFETEESAPVTIPYIVVIVDEMADLMMVAGKEIEACIQRLAQMARASGIHLIMATQRPSVDVITGTIKANFPTRISFQVTSKIDSRTILGEQGAEQLLGMGDMLYMAGGAKITRIHGPFVSDEEVEEIVSHLKSYGPPVYMSGVVEGFDDDKEGDIDLVLGLGGDGADDSLYDQAVAIVAKDRKCSTSYIQRKLGIGYNKAAKLVEQMEENHVVTTANHVGKREILIEER